MIYHDLQELIQNSRSSREYFLSLPVKTQCRLHDYHEHVHSAQELHRAVRAIEDVDRLDRLGGWDQGR